MPVPEVDQSVCPELFDRHAAATFIGTDVVMSEDKTKCPEYCEGPVLIPRTILGVTMPLAFGKYVCRYAKTIIND